MKRMKIPTLMILLLAFGPAFFMMVACSDDTGGSSQSSSSSSSFTGGAGGSGGVDGSGGGAAGGSGTAGGRSVGQCGRTCTVDAECCPQGLPNCPDGPYPYNFTCEDGVCKSPRCSIKEDCTSSGMLPNDDCVMIEGQRSCARPCTVDGDCSNGATCTRLDDSGNTLCDTTTPPFMCSDDAGCGGLGKCNATGDGCYCSEPGDCVHAYFKDCIQ